MKIGITGGTGNISKYITKYLLERGEEVILFNNMPVDDPAYQKAKIVVCDRYDREDFIEHASAQGEFDCVIDMICFEPEQAQIAIDAFAGHTQHFVFCSTVDAYTKDPKNYPIQQDFEKKPRPEFPYAYSKAICENMMQKAAADGAFELTILRPVATYSEGGSPLVHAFRGGSYHLDRIRKGKKIIMHGDGSSVWTTVHASDTARAFANAACNPKAYGKCYDLMGDECFSYRQYFNIMAEAMGAPPIDFVFITTDLLYRMIPDVADWCRENFMFNNIFDNTAAKEDLGFRYTISWYEGAKRCVEYLDAHQGLENSDEERFAFYDDIIKLYEEHAEQMIKTCQNWGKR
jgi:nucleoside-diphosphate-sugar epimerase